MNDRLQVHVLDTPSLGDRSYLVHDGEIAFVIDPQRDIDRIEALLETEGVRLTHVFETHIHNDYVTGGFALARRAGASYLLNGADPVSFARTGLDDGDEIAIGDRMRLRALATPGHTFTHLSYALTDLGEDFGAEGVFTGGSLLYGATGRPDLLGAEHTDALVRHQHASAHALAQRLPQRSPVYPTHGFGSFCSATPTTTDADTSTIGEQTRSNPALLRPVEDYAAEVLAGLGPWPSYYARMGPANLAGPTDPDLSPAADLAVNELSLHRADGAWLVDLRSRDDFAAGHLPGVLNFGLDGSFATYLGWLLPPATPVVLLGEDQQQITDAQRELVRIGIDRPAGQVVGGPATWAAAMPAGTDLEHHRVATFADLAAAEGEARDGAAAAPAVLDVRRRDEHASTALRGAANIPLPELVDRVAELPDGEIWVHCASGYRASIAASVIAASGRRPVAIHDGFGQAAGAGLDVIEVDAAESGEPAESSGSSGAR